MLEEWLWEHLGTALLKQTELVGRKDDSGSLRRLEALCRSLAPALAEGTPIVAARGWDRLMPPMARAADDLGQGAGAGVLLVGGAALASLGAFSLLKGQALALVFAHPFIALGLLLTVMVLGSLAVFAVARWVWRRGRRLRPQADASTA